MSLDLWMEAEPCKTCGRSGDPDFSWNYTHNVSKFWYSLYPESEKWLNIHGMTGEESLPVLNKFLEELQADPDRFIAMNPENGWGSYDTFVPRLKELIEAANEYPKCTWQGSW